MELEQTDGKKYMVVLHTYVEGVPEPVYIFGFAAKRADGSRYIGQVAFNHDEATRILRDVRGWYSSDTAEGNVVKLMEYDPNHPLLRLDKYQKEVKDDDPDDIPF